MRAEIISIGTELTTGRNLDTNSQWLSRRLAEMGVPVHWHTTIADDLDANLEAFRIAVRRAGLVLSSGGLGPTQDDLTREVLAKVAGVELVFDQESFDRIAEMFRRRGRTMPEGNRVQAYFPAGATVLPNDRGTAPGIWMRLGDCHVAAMPGVPSEMFAMFEAHIRPRLFALGAGGSVLIERKINCFGAGESQVEEKLLDLTRRGHVPEVGITASDATISLRIFASAPTREEALAQIRPVESTIRERLGDLVFGADDEELQDVVVRLLGEGRRTLAVAEGVTAGLIGERLARVHGASACFRGGVIAYDNTMKVQLLGVPESLIEEHGAVSAAVAEAMAEGCRRLLHADLAVSTVGIAGPGGGSVDKPVGLVFAGLAWEGGTLSRSSSWLATRAEVQSRTAKMALNLARLHLIRPAE
ncbi:MAG: competence/damage-inducible protein A [Planctomycetes bacterium]|nr:competence/damage-inducible protein A [Planctomycetota bacterium]